ncbi:hypothetical protein KGM_214705 [Danaus plexippus plexippus]|uniref:Uncharacterized protein n=1 Tax=Danaus plexippus plexippus TaxID=278856 RepID=A0A212FIB2_DANPL|nr:hypothetical protein KGM_214705 [Danaus plexippus plexippus]
MAANTALIDRIHDLHQRDAVICFPLFATCFQTFAEVQLKGACGKFKLNACYNSLDCSYSRIGNDLMMTH